MDKGNFQSLDAKLKFHGWSVESIILNSKLPEGLVELANSIKKGLYEKILIIPSKEARKGENWIPVKPSFLVYSKRSKKYREYLEKKPAVIMVAADCRYKDNSEEHFIPLI